jgi:hypothetical protein
MKKIFITILLMSCCKLYAQNAGKKTAIYYLLDVTKLPANANMWDITYDRPFRYYTIECPCLASNGKPTLIYNENMKARLINHADLIKLDVIKISELIKLSKQILDMGVVGYDVFLVEPYKTKYQVHQVKLSSTQKYVLTDYENVTPIDSSKKKKP